MKVVIQNLQKIPGLASQLVGQQNCDLMLVQEINYPSEEQTLRTENYHVARYTSQWKGYGTAILASKELSNIKRVPSPHAETGGFIVKKTTVATYEGIQFVSFHGYNGQPFQNVSKLLDHVKAVVEVLEPESPAVWAGDFNTWTQAHVEAVQQELERVGFQRAYSWPYPGRDIPLDHAFTRGVKVKNSSDYGNESDHRGAVLELVLAVAAGD
jgi:endonuclease/exonuclease/phosphatase family metal-dependent hydrolase